MDRRSFREKWIALRLNTHKRVDIGSPRTTRATPNAFGEDGSFTVRKRRTGVFLTTWYYLSCIITISHRGPSPNSNLAKSPRPFPCWHDKHSGKGPNLDEVALVQEQNTLVKSF
jgi:hypothetical protein